MPNTHLPKYHILQTFLQDPKFAGVWNALIPKSTILFELKPYGVRYLHATKGWKSVGKKRFAVRGVL
jgi:hypothetical protein